MFVPQYQLRRRLRKIYDSQLFRKRGKTERNGEKLGFQILNDLAI